jgi:hypothetical protein
MKTMLKQSDAKKTLKPNEPDFGVYMKALINKHTPLKPTSYKNHVKH